MFGGSAETPVAANHPSHAIVAAQQRDDRLSGRAVGDAGQRRQRRPPHRASSKPALAQLGGGRPVVALCPQPPSPDEGAGDKTGPTSIAAAVSAPVTEEKPAAAPGEGAAPAGDPRRRARRLRFRLEHALHGRRQSRPVREHRRLARQENLISIRPKAPSDRRLTMTAAQQSNITWFSLPSCRWRSLERVHSGGGGGNARTAIDDRAPRRARSGWVRIYFVTWKQDGNTTASTENSLPIGRRRRHPGTDHQGRGRRPHDRKKEGERWRIVAPIQAPPPNRTSSRHVRAGEPRRRAGRRREPRRSRAARPLVVAHRGGIQAQRRETARQAAARRQDADRQQRTR